MNIGIPMECMPGEHRVALTPAACAELCVQGHSVLVESEAGVDSGYDDEQYRVVGCNIAPDAANLYGAAELIVKVKQPLDPDLDHLHATHILFSYLHLAADRRLVKRLCDIGLTAIPFESIRDAAGSLPLLAPMSAIAGRIAAIRGASLLFSNRGGRGILLGGIHQADTSIDDGRVVVLGAGVAGSQAAATAYALGADVAVFDLDDSRLKTLKQQHARMTVLPSTPRAVHAACIDADLVIGAVLLSGRRAPVVLRATTVEQMAAGSVIIDIAIDQGGCVEGIEAVDSDTLFYTRHGVLHSAIPNMPAAVARTATQALSHAIAPCVSMLAETPLPAIISDAIALRDGTIVDSVLAEEVGD